jgi:hypothetical protein
MKIKSGLIILASVLCAGLAFASNSTVLPNIPVQLSFKTPLPAGSQINVTQSETTKGKTSTAPSHQIITKTPISALSPKYHLAFPRQLSSPIPSTPIPSSISFTFNIKAAPTFQNTCNKTITAVYNKSGVFTGTLNNNTTCTI